MAAGNARLELQAMTLTDDAIFSVEPLLRYIGADAQGRAIVTKIVRDSIAPAPRQLELTDVAIKSGQFAQALHILHNLRGSVGNLGARRFVTASLALELALAEERLPELPSLCSAVETELGAALEQARSWLSQAE